MTKKFIRFVCNTKNHPRGEKIKALNIITKVDGVVQKPYIYAQENQIEIDIEGTDYKKYLPLHHFKHKDGKIIKKTDKEIQAVEVVIAQRRDQKKIDRGQKEIALARSKDIMLDESKTDKERLEAAIDIIKNKL